MLSIEQINEIESELQMVKQELLLAQNQYNKVVEQNKSYNMRNMELEKVFKKILNIANICDMPSCLDADCNCDICHDEITENGKRCIQKGMREIIKLLTPPNDVDK